jgi:hypothetical protein
MVLLSAVICNKSGKALVARQFMEMSRSRVEGLLAAFPKLINAEEQHTFVETDNVRYVYQPLEGLYMVLITTKNSNILEDLETLRLFAKVAPEYCRVMTEAEVSRCQFDLIFAFDEVVALGFRESVNLSQIRIFIAMDSHHENVARMVKKNKEKEALEMSKRKAKELQLQRKEQARTGGGGKMTGFGGGSGMGGGQSDFGGSSISSSGGGSMSAARVEPVHRTEVLKKAGCGMKLGGKPKTADFVEALIAEGEDMSISQSSSAPAASAAAPSKIHTSPVHIKVEEKITLTANRDGGLEGMEVKGVVYLNVSDPELAKIRVTFDKSSTNTTPFQTHPNVDKKLFADENKIGLKNAEKPFPTHSEVGVVKWRIQASDDSAIPLTINCWPTVNSDGSCDVNVEYELLATHLELHDVVVSIPVPSGSGSPVVSTVDGRYNYDSRRSILNWTIDVVDKSSSQGALEFSCKSKSEDDFFPVLVNFTSPGTYAGLSLVEARHVDTGAVIPFSSEVAFSTDKYEYV